MGAMAVQREMERQEAELTPTGPARPRNLNCATERRLKKAFTFNPFQGHDPIAHPVQRQAHIKRRLSFVYCYEKKKVVDDPRKFSELSLDTHRELHVAWRRVEVAGVNCVSVVVARPLIYHTPATAPRRAVALSLRPGDVLQD
ncbi:hypothetical protein EVAR_90782_1 [Eumeta japonica]|uniref:Uncharacterized protein n=1 Tax=Eumeta variegata TaxID=151549 RepID=A0A4C1YI15_EUMVA|nr:hypothetical protein EVAR_90782_1 [Eumeta japonica]